MKKIKIATLIFFSLLVFIPSIFCQSSGKLFIKEKGFMSVFGKHSFTKGSGLLAPGKVSTSRQGERGYLNFTAGSDWEGARAGRFVDGYVCVFHSNNFIFPIGDNNNYRPVAISGARKTTAAYYHNSPSLKIEEISIASTDNQVGNQNDSPVRVSNREYWDIGGNTGVTLSLLWGANSNIANITNGKLDNLTLVGWRNGKWEIIPSIVKQQLPEQYLDKHPTLSKKSSFDTGVIETKEQIIPNRYQIITLGAIEDQDNAGERARTFVSDIVAVYPNPVVKDVFINLEKLGNHSGTIKIYNIYGMEVAHRSINSNDERLQLFDASQMQNGIYEIFVKIGVKTVSSKFVVGRMY